MNGAIVLHASLILRRWRRRACDISESGYVKIGTARRDELSSKRRESGGEP